MEENMNKVILKGRISKEPDVQALKDDKKVCKFTIAVNRRFKKDTADFINCVAWNQLADFVSKYFEKGSEIAVVGRIEIEKYVDKEGKNRYSENIIIDEAYFCGSKTEKPSSDKPANNNSTSPADDDFM